MCVCGGGTTTSQVVCFYFKYFFHFALPFLGSRKRTSGMYLGLVHFLEFSLRIFHERESNGGLLFPWFMFVPFFPPATTLGHLISCSNSSSSRQNLSPWSFTFSFKPLSILLFCVWWLFWRFSDSFKPSRNPYLERSYTGYREVGKFSEWTLQQHHRSHWVGWVGAVQSWENSEFGFFSPLWILITLSFLLSILFLLQYFQLLSHL